MRKLNHYGIVFPAWSIHQHRHAFALGELVSDIHKAELVIADLQRFRTPALTIRRAPASQSCAWFGQGQNNERELKLLQQQTAQFEKACMDRHQQCALAIGQGTLEVFESPARFDHRQGVFFGARAELEVIGHGRAEVVKRAARHLVSPIGTANQRQVLAQRGTSPRMRHAVTFCKCAGNAASPFNPEEARGDDAGIKPGSPIQRLGIMWFQASE